METVTKAIREFLTWWLGTFGVSDPAYVNFAMAAVALIALVVGIGAIIGVLAAIFEGLKR